VHKRQARRKEDKARGHAGRSMSIKGKNDVVKKKEKENQTTTGGEKKRREDETPGKNVRAPKKHDDRGREGGSKTD